MKQIMKLTMVGLFCLGLSTACEDYPDPTPFAPNVTTGEADNLYRKGATLYGSYDTSAGDQVKEVGIMVSIVRSMAEPTVLAAQVGESNYSAQVTGLEPNREYFYQAYVSSGISTATGEVKSFTTPSTTAPVFSELRLLGKEDGSPIIGVSLVDNGGLDMSMQGFCWKAMSAGDTSAPTFEDNIVNVPLAEMGRYTLKGLQPNTTYAIRAWGNNGTVGYSNTVTFQTEIVEPGVVITPDPSSMEMTIDVVGDTASSYDYAHFNLAEYNDAAICQAFDLTADQITERIHHSSEGLAEGKICMRLKQADGSYSYDDNCGGELGGFWCDANGNLQNWGEDARTYTKLHTIYDLEVGFMPGTMNAGETYPQVIQLVYMLNGTLFVATINFNFIIEGEQQQEITAPVFSELKLVDVVEGKPVVGTSLTDNGGQEVTASGFCWKAVINGDTNEPTENDESVTVSLPEMERYTLTGLQPSTTYAIRAWANNGLMGYSNVLTVETDASGEVIFNGEINPWGSPTQSNGYGGGIPDVE